MIKRDIWDHSFHVFRVEMSSLKVWKKTFYKAPVYKNKMEKIPKSTNSIQFENKIKSLASLKV